MRSLVSSLMMRVQRQPGSVASLNSLTNLIFIAPQPGIDGLFAELLMTCAGVFLDRVWWKPTVQSLPGSAYSPANFRAGNTATSQVLPQTRLQKCRKMYPDDCFWRRIGLRSKIRIWNKKENLFFSVLSDTSIFFIGSNTPNGYDSLLIIRGSSLASF